LLQGLRNVAQELYRVRFANLRLPSSLAHLAGGLGPNRPQDRIASGWSAPPHRGGTRTAGIQRPETSGGVSACLAEQGAPAGTAPWAREIPAGRSTAAAMHHHLRTKLLDRTKLRAAPGSHSPRLTQHHWVKALTAGLRPLLARWQSWEFAGPWVLGSPRALAAFRCTIRPIHSRGRMGRSMF
jgi:hypothetical protein